MTDLSLARHIGAVLADGIADPDPAETAEWREALDALIAAHGPARARFMLDALLAHARAQRRRLAAVELATPYVNTIAVEEQPPFPGDLAIEERLAALMRWNALAMVVRANQALSASSAATSPATRQRGRPVRGRLQPFLPRASDGARRRPGVLPAALARRASMRAPSSKAG